MFKRESAYLLAYRSLSKVLQKEKETLEVQSDKLANENAQLKDENDDLQEEIRLLKEENSQLRNGCTAHEDGFVVGICKLTEQLDKVTKDHRELKTNYEALQKEYDELMDDFSDLEDEIEDEIEERGRSRFRTSDPIFPEIKQNTKAARSWKKGVIEWFSIGTIAALNVRKPGITAAARSKSF